MHADLRRRLFVALSLGCAIAPSACKKDDGESIEPEGTPKKKKPKPTADPTTEPKKAKVWTLPGSANKPVHCGHVNFCTTGRPEVTYPSDASALATECGSSVKVPKEALIPGFPESFNAHFIEYVTKEERDKGEAEACCYGYQTGPCGKGRPLRDESGFVLADLVPREGWAGVDVGAAAAGLSRAWLPRFEEAARLEHGSVAAFAALSLELLALGAPADLVAAAHTAALDEIRHAQVFCALASALRGAPVGPGPLAVPAARPADVDRLIVETVVDGCVGETLGSLLFQEIARQAPPALGALFAQVAEEEAQHAELAFRVVRFLVGDDPARLALARRAAAAVPRTSPSGLADPDTQRAVFDQGHRSVVMPVFAAMTVPPRGVLVERESS